ncbi:hypothetical protein DYB31_005002 [Aphanomyces astaci]|uniref:BED-type domain-containing protein n=1 Tax=Aphanomyces astaci TaxID=112090 RepID=A0A397FZL2_APHAT|nr:hypothetical protein DYB31_005002 [Aphanomyces astaci]
MTNDNNQPSPLRGKQLAELYFTRSSPESTLWLCKCGKRRTQNGTGYTNLTSHIEREHPEYLTYDATAPISEQNLFMPLFSRNVRNVYGWLTWITSSLLPFNFCENEMARRYSNLGPISNKTLMKWMHQMCRRLEAKLKKTLPESFACVFDAWTCGSTYYVAVFASFPSDSLHGYEKVLLALSPMNDEDSLSAAAFLDFFDFVLDVYGKQRRNVVALIGDNCATNRAFTRLAGIPMVGCASHRFNLFVGDVLADYEDLLCAVHAIMKKLSNIIPAAKLRRMTPLSPLPFPSTDVEHVRAAVLCDEMGDDRPPSQCAASKL